MDTDEQLVTVELRRDNVALVRLTNGKVNTLSSALLAQLAEVAKELTDDPPGAVVLSGGEKIFAAGADISEFAGADEARLIGGLFTAALNAVAAIPRVSIAAINGVALGGGCELALACDFRIANERARLGQPEILLGIIPGGGGTQRLARLVGSSRSKDLILSGRQVKAEEALRIGLLDRVVEGDAESAALEWAAEFASGPLAAQALAKAAIDSGLDHDLESGLEIEQNAFAEVFRTEDAAIGVQSFLSKGPGQASFKGC